MGAFAFWKGTLSVAEAAMCGTELLLQRARPVTSPERALASKSYPRRNHDLLGNAVRVHCFIRLRYGLDYACLQT